VVGGLIIVFSDLNRMTSPSSFEKFLLKSTCVISKRENDSVTFNRLCNKLLRSICHENATDQMATISQGHGRLIYWTLEPNIDLRAVSCNLLNIDLDEQC